MSSGSWGVTLLWGSHFVFRKWKRSIVFQTMMEIEAAGPVEPHTIGIRGGAHWHFLYAFWRTEWKRPIVKNGKKKVAEFIMFMLKVGHGCHHGILFAKDYSITVHCLSIHRCVPQVCIIIQVHWGRQKVMRKRGCDDGGAEVIVESKEVYRAVNSLSWKVTCLLSCVCCLSNGH